MLDTRSLSDKLEVIEKMESRNLEQLRETIIKSQTSNTCISGIPFFSYTSKNDKPASLKYETVEALISLHNLSKKEMGTENSVTVTILERVNNTSNVSHLYFFCLLKIGKQQEALSILKKLILDQLESKGEFILAGNTLTYYLNEQYFLYDEIYRCLYIINQILKNEATLL
ncbi:MAG: hypothetical protein AABX82_08170, partial [Nanoarchaeota archaeon]